MKLWSYNETHSIYESDSIQCIVNYVNYAEKKTNNIIIKFRRKFMYGKKVKCELHWIERVILERVSSARMKAE